MAGRHRRYASCHGPVQSHENNYVVEICSYFRTDLGFTREHSQSSNLLDLVSLCENVGFANHTSWEKVSEEAFRFSKMYGEERTTDDVDASSSETGSLSCLSSRLGNPSSAWCL